MDKVEIKFFDLDNDTYVDLDIEEFNKNNPDFDPFELMLDMMKSKVAYLTVNGQNKRILELENESDNGKMTIKFQDVHESIYKKY